MKFDLSNNSQQTRTPEQQIQELRSEVRALERRISEQGWETNPDRQGGHTPPNEILDPWDQWGH